jgi:hypothetical protein
MSWSPGTKGRGLTGRVSIKIVIKLHLIEIIKALRERVK